MPRSSRLTRFIYPQFTWLAYIDIGMQVFNKDIRNLLSMEDMWRFRDKPVPLDFDAIKDDTFTLRGSIASASVLAGGNTAPASNGSAEASSSSAKLKDQKALSLRDSWELFVHRLVDLLTLNPCSPIRCSTERLAARLKAGEEVISFDKDDDDTLDFVTASANLRSAAYGIPGKTRWEVKGQHRTSCCIYPLTFSYRNGREYYTGHRYY